jgi:exopolyphosphatase/guanosine-5'-triphosphate,3'-diphosphate pyrophosphatase
VTRLGEGQARTGALGETPMARTAEAVASYVERARALGASEIVIVGTSAVREAENGHGFVRSLGERTGVAVEIISGEDEARLTVRGVLDGLDRPPGALIVFDIGGGSTEYTLVDDGTIVASVSLRLGVVPLAERFPVRGRVSAAGFEDIEAAVESQLRRELPARLTSGHAARLIGTAGTVTTLAALDLGLHEYDPARVNGHVLDRNAIARQRDRLCGLTADERGALPCLEPGRADLIVPGLAIVTATMAELSRETLIVSDMGLREGLMSEGIERRWSI